jgi:hypothetical protein
MDAMTRTRTAVLLLFAGAAIYGASSSWRSYERLQFYTNIEPDYSIAESYEVELWLEVPATLVCVAAALIAAAPLRRRRRS